VSERGSDLHDGAGIAGDHAPKRRQRTVDGAEVGDLRDAAELSRIDLVDRGEDRRHRVVNPDVDGSELGFHPLGGCLAGIGVRDVSRDDQRLPTGCLDVFGCASQSRLAAGDEADPVAPGAECLRGSPAGAGARPGDNNDLRRLIGAHESVLPAGVRAPVYRSQRCPNVTTALLRRGR
jgi:hypothetical protein